MTIGHIRICSFTKWYHTQGLAKLKHDPVLCNLSETTGEGQKHLLTLNEVKNSFLSNSQLSKVHIGNLLEKVAERKDAEKEIY